jgi:hypothetical protein
VTFIEQQETVEAYIHIHVFKGVANLAETFWSSKDFDALALFLAANHIS